MADMLEYYRAFILTVTTLASHPLPFHWLTTLAGHPLPFHWLTTLAGHPLPTTNHHHNTHYFPIQLFFLECLNLKVLQSFKLLPTTSSMTHCHTVKTGIIIHTSHSSINSMAAGRVIYLLNRHKMGKA
jgi:hypothetical protein